MRIPSFVILLLLAGNYGISLADEDASTAPPTTTADQQVEDASSINGADNADRTAAELATDAAAKLDESDGDNTSSDADSLEDEKEEEAGGEEEEEEETPVVVEGAEHDDEDAAPGDDAGSHDAEDTATTQEDGGAEEEDDDADSPVDDGEGDGVGAEEEEADVDTPPDQGDDDNLTAAAAAEEPLSGDDVVEDDSPSPPAEGSDDGTGDGFIDGWGGRDIEGEGHPFSGALASYDALLKEHYLKMSFAQATALGVVGDTMAQRLERRWNPGQKFEWRRTAHAGILNMVIDGIFTPHWYNLVDFVNEERTLPVAIVKALAASVFYAPFANGLFLAGARTLRYGPKAHFDWAEWRRQLMVCTIRDFEMWPPLHILSFWLLPKHWRPLTSHLAGVALLAVISSTGLTDADLPLGQRAVPLMMRWAREASDAVGERYWVPLETLSQYYLPLRWRPLSSSIQEAGFMVILSIIANDRVHTK